MLWNLVHHPTLKKPPLRGATPRRDGLSSHAADAVPRGFRVVLPAGCRGGQVLRVQSPEGMQVPPVRWMRRGMPCVEKVHTL